MFIIGCLINIRSVASRQVRRASTAAVAAAAKTKQEEGPKLELVAKFYGFYPPQLRRENIDKV